MAGTALRAILFDMDGVILDTERVWQECWLEMGEQWQLPDMLRTCHDCIGITNEASAEIFNRRYGPTVTYQAFAEAMRGLFHEKTENGVPLKAGAGEQLRVLRREGWPMALASSTSGRTIRAELEPLGLYGLFDAVISGDMVSRSKPAPDIFLQAAAALDIPPEACCVVEDSYNGIRAAHAAGCLPIMVPDLLQPTPEIRALCWQVCDTLADAAQVIRRSR